MTVTGLSGMSALHFQQASAEPDLGVCGSVDPNTGFLLYFQKIETGLALRYSMSAQRLPQASAESDPGLCGSVFKHRGIVLYENRNILLLNFLYFLP
jgi:hypothetical protein